MVSVSASESSRGQLTKISDILEREFPFLLMLFTQERLDMPDVTKRYEPGKGSDEKPAA